MKTRTIAIGVALAAVVALGFGVGVASGQSSAGDAPSPGWEAMDAMHNSSAMERLREQMGPQLGALCDQMHAQMQGRAGLMGGQGMMGGSPQHEAHHPDGAGWDS